MRKISTNELKNEWRTPKWLFNKLNHLYGPFTLDACATADNSLCGNFLYDCFAQDWQEVVFCNPPYSPSSLRKSVIKRGISQLENKNCESITFLVGPSDFSTTATKTLLSVAEQICIIHPRVKFLFPDGTESTSPGIGVFAANVTQKSILRFRETNEMCYSLQYLNHLNTDQP